MEWLNGEMEKWKTGGMVERRKITRNPETRNNEISHEILKHRVTENYPKS